MARTELDYMEYSSDALAQAAYVSSDGDVGLDSNTALLMHMDGSDDGTTFSDSSTETNKGNATVHGNVVTKTGTKKWGTASAYFPGANRVYLSYANHADYNFVGSSSQDYTIDFWVKFANHTGDETLINQYDNDNNTYYFNLHHTDGTGFILYITTIGAARVNISGGEITDTNWHHVAVCKVTSAGPTVEWGIYVDGTQVAYASDASTHSTSSILAIGADIWGGTSLEGYIDELRIQKSNIFDAAPNVGKTDTITVPTKAYSAPNFQSYSEDTIKTQGSYSLKGIAAQTNSLNDTLTRTI